MNFFTSYLLPVTGTIIRILASFFMKKVNLTILVIVFFLGIVSFLMVLKSQQAENVIYNASLPFLKAARFLAQKIVYPFQTIILKQNKSVEIQALKKENLALKGRLSELKEVKKENELLKNHLNVDSPPIPKKVLVHVIGKRADWKGTVYLINAGKKQGIKENQTVILPGGILVGRVLEAYEDFAKVLPVTNKASAIAVFTQDSRVEGILRGQGKQKKLVLDLISFHKEVAKENVITSGMDQIFVPGILIGKITKVEFLPQESSKQALVEPLYNDVLVEKVFVLQ